MSDHDDLRSELSLIQTKLDEILVLLAQKDSGRPSLLSIKAVSQELGCSPAKISVLARTHRVGVNLGGSAGWRFTPADVDALLRALRPKVIDAPLPARRKKRRHVAW